MKLMLSKNVFNLYNSLLYRLINIAYTCLGIYICLTQHELCDQIVGILIVGISFAYYLSTKMKSYMLMWIVLFMQIVLAIALV